MKELLVKSKHLVIDVCTHHWAVMLKKCTRSNSDKMVTVDFSSDVRCLSHWIYQLIQAKLLFILMQGQQKS